MDPHPIVVVGSGLAAWTTIKELRKHDAQVPVVMVTATSGDAYPKPALSTAFAQGKEASQLRQGVAADLAAANRVLLQAHTQALSIDLAAQQLHTSQGTQPYSRLVLAHGAQPIRIALEGDAADQVLSVNQLEDYVLLRQRLQPGARVLIMGAGLIGCEFANDLAGAGFKVEVVDPSPRPLAMLLPEDASRQLAQALSALGVVWHWGTSVTSVKQHDGAIEASLNNGTALTVDLVLSAIGLRANTDWLKASGLSCDRGVLVNHTLQTSDPQVYALGDVAQYASANNRTLPYVMPIMTAARALGATLAGKPTEVVFPVMPVAVKTPAYPLLLASPPPQAAGAWVLAEEGVWRFQNAQGPCLGFVLGGGKTSMRAKALQWLAPA
ncbi:MAG: hypothetical protein RI998_67 [Pseudomonadota bacterium]